MHGKPGPSFSDLSTFKVGGPIAHLIRAPSPESFIRAVAERAAFQEPFIIVGGGSNLLPSDEHYPGTVVIPAFDAVGFSEDGSSVMVRAEAGGSWDALVETSVSRGLFGIENLSGIPGTVGGACVANIGAYGAALSDVFISAEVYDIKTAARRSLTARECGLGYRRSVFKREPERYAILAATLRLSPVPRPRLLYRDLAAAFPSGNAALSDIRAAVLAIRTRKFPPLSAYGTAGSFFLNPIVSPAEVASVERAYPGIPFFTLPEGGIKVPLAWILDHVVHAKGMREGHAFVWDDQPLVIATERGARSRDVHSLAEKISRAVKEKTGLSISYEVRIL